MPRRRTQRLTTKKKHKISGADPEAPTAQEWATMTKYGSFGVQDEDGEEYFFKTGETVTLVPDKSDPRELFDLEEAWVARIKEIRCRSADEDLENDVWVRVQWYWSGDDVAGLIKSFNASRCGRYERIISDHYDYVSSLSLNEVIQMNRYEEDQLDPPDIEDEEFYCRYTLEYKSRKVDPKQVGTCICSEPYNPDDMSEDHLMHFCPRPDCRKWYHRRCLVKNSYVDESNFADHPTRLLASSPDTNEPFVFPEAEPLPKRSRFKADSKRFKRLPDPEELLSSLPTDLVTVAQQPIIKGGHIGVAGNVRWVVNARRMLYNALAIYGGSVIPVPDDWEESVNVEKAVRRGVGKNKIPALVCPKCHGPV